MQAAEPRSAKALFHARVAQKKHIIVEQDLQKKLEAHSHYRGSISALYIPPLGLGALQNAPVQNYKRVPKDSLWLWKCKIYVAVLADDLAQIYDKIFMLPDELV